MWAQRSRVHFMRNNHFSKFSSCKSQIKFEGDQHTTKNSEMLFCSLVTITTIWRRGWGNLGRGCLDPRCPDSKSANGEHFMGDFCFLFRIYNGIRRASISGLSSSGLYLTDYLSNTSLVMIASWTFAIQPIVLSILASNRIVQKHTLQFLWYLVVKVFWGQSRESMSVFKVWHNWQWIEAHRAGTELTNYCNKLNDKLGFWTL